MLRTLVVENSQSTGKGFASKRSQQGLVLNTSHATTKPCVSLALFGLWDDLHPLFATALPCDQMEFFSVCTDIELVNDGRDKIWVGQQLHGHVLKDLALSICSDQQKQTCQLRRPQLRIGGCVVFIKSHGAYGWIHLSMGKGVEDAIIHRARRILWKITRDGCYSVASRYDFQVLGILLEPLLNMMRKIMDDRKVRANMWLLIQKMVGPASFAGQSLWSSSQ